MVLKLKKKQKPNSPEAKKEVHSPRSGTVPKLSTPEPEESADKILKSQALSSLMAQADETESEGRQFMEPAAAPRKRGRPRKDPNAAPPPPQPESDAPPPQPEAPAFDCKPACTMAFGVLSALIVRTMGSPKYGLSPHQAVQFGLLPEEIHMLGDAWGAVANKYMPSFLAKYGEIVIAVSVTGAVGARIYQVSAQISTEKMAEYEADRLRRRTETQTSSKEASLQ